MSTKYTNQDLEYMLAAYQNGIPLSEVVLQLGRTPYGIVQKLRTLKFKDTKWSPVYSDYAHQHTSVEPPTFKDRKERINSHRRKAEEKATDINPIYRTDAQNELLHNLLSSYSGIDELVAISIFNPDFEITCRLPDEIGDFLAANLEKGLELRVDFEMHFRSLNGVDRINRATSPNSYYVQGRLKSYNGRYRRCPDQVLDFDANNRSAHLHLNRVLSREITSLSIIVEAQPGMNLAQGIYLIQIYARGSEDVQKEPIKRIKERETSN